MRIPAQLGALVALITLTNAIAVDSKLSQRQSTDQCASGAHIIVTRGSTEPTPEGMMGEVATMIQQRIPGSDSVGVAYPATTANPRYIDSEGEGTKAIKAYVRKYVKSCPDTGIVLLGYSQGAQATMDALCGTSETDFATTKPLIGEFAHHIAAIVVYGDPSHVYPQSYDVGTSKHSGAFPRMKTGPCQKYANRLQSYCDYNDIYCDNGTSVAVHHSYFDKYNQDATDFVVSKFDQYYS